MRFHILVQPYLRKRGETIKNPGAIPDRYQEFLENLKTQMQFADKNGYGGFCMTEHHLQVEGIETTINPIMLDMFVAQHTENLHVGQLGMALTAHNPIKIAEDIALLDQMTQGRCYAGFVRGNTPRWLNTFSQHLGISTTQSDKSEIDQKNRRLFYEAWDIVKKLWTQDTVRYEGEFWQIPPKDIHWSFPPTLNWGAGTEIDENQNLHEIGLVPKCYQRPHPPVYTPFSWSMETAKFWAREGGKLASFVAKDEFVEKTIDIYLEEAAAHGRENVTPNDAIGIGGHLVMGRTETSAKSHKEGFEELFNGAYNCPPYNVPMGRVFGGTGQETLDVVAGMHDKYGIEEFFVWHHVNYFEQEEELEMLEVFADEVIKKF